MTIHFEGHRSLRPGFHKLFEPHLERARQRRIRFNLIAGGSRAEAVKDFLRSCKLRPHHINVLLIDSEDPVFDTTVAIRSLRNQSYWDEGVDCEDNQINLMVQSMEAWFIADRQAFTHHFGQDFNLNALPSPQDAESVAPDDLTNAIRGALRYVSRRKRGYDKVTDGVKLLQLIDHAAVSKHCRHFKRLMDYLTREI